jgi:hypothetical protein
MKTKTALLAAAGALGIAVPLLLSSAASARTYERCDRDGDHCVRVHCDYDGDRCWRESQYYRSNYYGHRGRWICDNDGDRCHYIYNGYGWNPHWSDRDRDDDRNRDYDHRY